MSELPRVNGARVVRALVLLRQTGSHAQLRHETDISRRVSVPVHKGVDLKTGTLRAILKGAGMSAEDLKALL